MLLVVSVGYFWISKSSRTERQPTPAIGTLAILPFKTLDPDSTEEYLGFAIADGLITKFSVVKNINVRPLSTVRKYSTPSIDAVAVGKELQVDAILDGSIHRVGDTLRVTAQLIDVGNNKVLWSEKFERPFSDTQDVGEVITSRVTAALALNLDPEEKSLLAKRYTENGEAYEAYMKGRFFMDKRTQEGVRKGFAYFEEAVKRDPNYAPAYLGEADYYLVAGNWLIPRAESHRKAELTVLKALELDDELAEAHAFLGQVRATNWQWAGAESELKRALELNPRSSVAHLHYSYYLAMLGRLNDAFDEMKQAQQLNPLSALNSARLAALHAFLGRYEESIKLCEKALELDPEFTICRDVLGWVYLKTGRHAESIAAYEKAVSLSKDEFYSYGELGYAYAITGRRKDALKVIASLKSRKYQEAVYYPSALIYAGLGDKDEAFRCLNNSISYHDDYALLLNIDPQLESLRADPRFNELLRRMGLPNT